VSALFLTVGIVMVSGGMQTANACHGCHQDDVVRKDCSGRTASPRSCFDALDLETIYQACYQTKEKKKRTVNFFVLGETDINTTNGTFKNLTQPGQGLIFKYSKQGSSGQEKSITFTTDQSLTYDFNSPDSKYPIWRVTDTLSDGTYTGTVYYDDFEKTASLSGAILTQIFTVDRTHTAVMMAPYLYN